jgi:hypothetical protein
MYGGVDISKWNVEVEPFVAWWIVQIEEDKHGLGTIEDHMPPWSVAGKEIYYCWLVLRLQEGRDIDQP